MKKLYKLLKHQEINNFVDIGYQNVGELFNNKVLENRDKIFLICPGSNLEKFTYLQFYEMVEKTIMFLENYELKKNDIISIIFTNSVEFLLIYFAGLRMGLTIVPINPDITSNEMRFIINNSKSSFTFYDYKFEPKIKDLKKMSSNFISISSKMDLINIEKSKNFSRRFRSYYLYIRNYW